MYTREHIMWNRLIEWGKWTRALTTMSESKTVRYMRDIQGPRNNHHQQLPKNARKNDKRFSERTKSVFGVREIAQTNTILLAVTHTRARTRIIINSADKEKGGESESDVLLDLVLENVSEVRLHEKSILVNALSGTTLQSKHSSFDYLSFFVRPKKNKINSNLWHFI